MSAPSVKMHAMVSGVLIIHPRRRPGVRILEKDPREIAWGEMAVWGSLRERGFRPGCFPRLPSDREPAGRRRELGVEECFGRGGVLSAGRSGRHRGDEG